MGQKEDEAACLAADQRYHAAAHAVQSGIAMWMNLDPMLFTPKQMRVGIDTQKSDLWGLAKLLMDKGVFTRVEYHEAMANAMEEEKQRWERELSERMGQKRFAGVNDKQLFRAMRHARGEELEALRREASRRGLQEEVKGE